MRTTLKYARFIKWKQNLEADSTVWDKGLALVQASWKFIRQQNGIISTYYLFYFHFFTDPREIKIIDVIILWFYLIFFIPG